jgi:hypothetical protein
MEQAVVEGATAVVVLVSRRVLEKNEVAVVVVAVLSFPQSPIQTG